MIFISAGHHEKAQGAKYLTFTEYHFAAPWADKKELLFTTRCARHLKDSSGWRLRNAQWVCNYLLNPFDEGHCE